jgi:hypothetical protein
MSSLKDNLTIQLSTPMSTLNGGLLSPPAANQKGSTSLASKVTSILSTSYSDTEFRDALALLDERGVQNDAETRRQIRTKLQKEVILSNGEVIVEFGRVAEVCVTPFMSASWLTSQ